MSSEKIFKVVLDSNIYVSALLFGGKPEKIVFLASENKIDLIVSPAIINEVAGVFHQKFNWTERSVLVALSAIKEVSRFVYPKQKISAIGYRLDNIVLEAANEGKADFIVTGDKKHILPLKQFKEINIVTASEFLSVYESS